MDWASAVANPASRSPVGAVEGDPDSIPTTSWFFRARDNRGPSILKFPCPWPLLSSSLEIPWSKQDRVGRGGAEQQAEGQRCGLRWSLIYARGLQASSGGRCALGRCAGELEGRIGASERGRRPIAATDRSPDRKRFP